MTTSFDPKTHSYLIDGKPATGITTIISVLAKPALIGWAAKMTAEFIQLNGKWSEDKTQVTITGKQLEEAKSAHRKKKEEAGVKGTDAHTLVEEYITTCLKIGRAHV